MKPELRNTLTKLMWIALILLGLVLVISAVNRKERSKTKAVTIDIAPMSNGEFMIDTSDVRQAIFDAFGFHLETKAVGQVDVARVERILEQQPFILDAEVYINAFNSLNIDLIQREPVIRIMDREGRNYYLDQSGVKLPKSKHYTQRVLVASGYVDAFDVNYQAMEQHNLNELLDLALIIRNDAFWLPMVEQVHVQSNKEFVLVPKLGKQEILFGKYEKVEDKLFNLKAFYQQALPYKGWNRYQKIDARFEGQVIGIK